MCQKIGRSQHRLRSELRLLAQAHAFTAAKNDNFDTDLIPAAAGTASDKMFEAMAGDNYAQMPGPQPSRPKHSLAAHDVTAY